MQNLLLKGKNHINFVQSYQGWRIWFSQTKIFLFTIIYLSFFWNLNSVCRMFRLNIVGCIVIRSLYISPSKKEKKQPQNPQILPNPATQIFWLKQYRLRRMDNSKMIRQLMVTLTHAQIRWTSLYVYLQYSQLPGFAATILFVPPLFPPPPHTQRKWVKPVQRKFQPMKLQFVHELFVS